VVAATADTSEKKEVVEKKEADLKTDATGYYGHGGYGGYGRGYGGGYGYGGYGHGKLLQICVFSQSNWNLEMTSDVMTFQEVMEDTEEDMVDTDTVRYQFYYFLKFPHAMVNL